MPNQLKMSKIKSILALREQGRSFSRIARELGIHRQTVARYVREHSKSPEAPTGSDDPKSAKTPTGSSGSKSTEAPRLRAGFEAIPVLVFFMCMGLLQGVRGDLGRYRLRFTCPSVFSAEPARPLLGSTCCHP